MALTRAPPGSATVVIRFPSLLLDNDSAALLYAKLKLMRNSTGLSKESDKNLRLPEESYNRLHDGYVRLAPIFNEYNEAQLNRTSLFTPLPRIPPLTDGMAAAKEAKPYKVAGGNDNAL